MRALGVSKDPDVDRTLQLVKRLEEQRRELTLKMDKSFIHDEKTISEWLEGRNLKEFVKLFEENKIDFETLADLTYDDLKEMGVSEIGPRRKLFKEIAVWREGRDISKEDAIRAQMKEMDAPIRECV